MKTAMILTSEESFHNNYGAALQGYALYKLLQEQGIAPQIIRYEGGKFQDSFLKYRIIRTKKYVRSRIRKLLLNRKVSRNLPFFHKYAVKINRREQLFLSFQKEEMQFYNHRRMIWYELKKSAPKADYYICGSDQIWNPYFKNGYNDPGYFLAFAPAGSVKIAYGPSFGCDDLPEKAQKDLAELLKDFKAISVRETAGVEIVRRYGHRKAEHVLDPTLLRMDYQWREISRRPEGLPEQYILCYRFADSEQTKAMIDRISHKTGLPVVSLPLSAVALNDDYPAVFEAGPREFIGLIDHASLVCTDSFHATVFSILMKTPVCVFPRESYRNGNSMNSRIYSLLHLLQLEHHLIKEDTSLDEAINCLNEDYIKAQEILNVERKKSMNFLKSALAVERK